MPSTGTTSGPYDPICVSFPGDVAAGTKLVQLDIAVETADLASADAILREAEVAFKRQTDLLVNAFANGMARVATLQYTNSVGQARMRWLNIHEDHHHLSHESDNNADAQEKLVKINTWLCEQLANLARKLDAIQEPGGQGTMLDNTTIVWTNELGKGNSHSLDNIPFVLVGGGLGFKTGQALQFDNVPHNRLWLSIAHAFGHHLPAFGHKDFSQGGALALA